MKKCYKSGDIILVQYPFTDLSSSKVRPALVIRDQADSDIICLPITSSFGVSEHDIAIKKNETEGFSFSIQSFIRPRKIATLNIKLIRKHLGKLQREVFSSIKEETLEFLSE
jgi:mRNA interferase MazF